MVSVETEPVFATRPARRSRRISVNRRCRPAFTPTPAPVRATHTATTEPETFTVGFSTVTVAFTDTAANPPYGIICANNPVNFRDACGTCETQPSSDDPLAILGVPQLSPKFQPPTNPPQMPPPPENLPPGWKVWEHPEPAPNYENGYWKLLKPLDNGGWQRIDPSTMKPGTHPETHVPFPPAPPPPSLWMILLRIPILIITVPPEYINYTPPTQYET